jgi:hypothetical protein
LRWTSTAHDWDRNFISPRQPVMEDISQVTLNAATLGPHQEIRNLMNEPIPVAYTYAIRAQKMRVYVHGTLIYDDFLSSDHHITRFCYFLYGQPGVNRPTEFEYGMCGAKTNCADEECDAADVKLLPTLD